VQGGGPDAQPGEAAGAAGGDDEQFGVLPGGHQRDGGEVVDLVGAGLQLRVAHRQDVADLVQQGARVGSSPCGPPGKQMGHQRQGVQDAQGAAAQQRLAGGPVGGGQAGVGAVDSDGDG
jgi:hypothetical protein